jgi:PAS domain S-box-containing protein
MSLSGTQWVRERSVGTKLLILILPIVAFFVLSLEWYFAWHRDMARVEESVTQQAQMVVTQIMADRAYYTKVVVPRIEQLGGQLTAQYHEIPGGLPLPATFMREVSEMTRSGQGHYTAELLSPWPINKKQGVLDPFQQEGFAYLTQHREGIFSRIEVMNGQRTLRFLKGDFASAEACATCHNTHPDSPKRDFRQNDLMGGVEIRIPLEPWLVKVRQDEGMLLMWGAGICLTLVGVIWYGVHRIVTKPLGVLTRLMKKLLAGSTGLQTESRFGSASSPELSDEVKSLWKAFAEMEQIIKRQHGELQWTNVKLKEQVAERTALLQRTLHTWLKTDPGALALIQAAPLPIILAHPNGRIDTMNGPALQGFGYDSGAVAGQPITLLIAEPDWQRAVAQLWQGTVSRETTGAPLAVQVQGLRKGGKRFLLETALSVIGQDGDERLLLTMPDLNETRSVN